jgi:putative glutamine amidotransferase
MPMPLIGISSDWEMQTDRRGAPAPRYFLAESYVRAVEAAGADAVILPHTEPARAARLLERLDGVVVSGGDLDVPPAWYGEAPSPKLGKQIPARSEFERELLLKCLARDLPVLGVCGGMQLMNVVLGGSLYQDLSDRPKTAVHVQPHDKRQPAHAVAVAAGSLLARVSGKQSLDVNSTHHQIVKELGDGVVACATAPDGVIEAIELPGRRWVLGVQWHPEALATDVQLAIYRALVSAARA